jgi:predicted transcriptional regulator
MDEMTPEERALITNELLSSMPAFGEFGIITHVARAKSERFLKEKDVISGLISEGFIINRNDLKADYKKYIQLTDTGRELKELGSMESYNRVQQARKDSILADADHRATERLRSKYLYYLTWSIGISTGVAALYYLKELYVYFFEN